MAPWLAWLVRFPRVSAARPSALCSAARPAATCLAATCSILRRFPRGDAAGIAATLLLVGRAMKWIAGISKAVAPAVEAGARALGNGGGAAAGVGGATVAKTTGSRFIPFIGWALTAISVIEAITDLIPEDEVSKMKSQAEAASGQAAKIRDRLQRNTELVNAFDPNAANPEPGTPAPALPSTRRPWRTTAWA